MGRRVSQRAADSEIAANQIAGSERVDTSAHQLSAIRAQGILCEIPTVMGESLHVRQWPEFRAAATVINLSGNFFLLSTTFA
jgi:hypothetical protein